MKEIILMGLKLLKNVKELNDVNYNWTFLNDVEDEIINALINETKDLKIKKEKHWQFLKIWYNRL